VVSADTSADALLEATIESIYRHGLAATTVTTVTELAGLSRGMVRHTFSSKQEMLVQTMERLWADWADATEPDPNAGPLEQVQSIVREMFAPDVFTTPRVAAWLALTSAAGSNADFSSICIRTYTVWTQQLARAMSGHGVAEPFDSAVALLATSDGLWLRHSLEPQLMTRELAERLTLETADALMV